MPSVILLLVLLATAASGHPLPLRAVRRSLAESTESLASGPAIKYAPCSDATEVTCSGQPNAAADGGDDDAPDPSRPICCNKVRPCGHLAAPMAPHQSLLLLL